MPERSSLSLPTEALIQQTEALVTNILIAANAVEGAGLALGLGLDGLVGLLGGTSMFSFHEGLWLWGVAVTQMSCARAGLVFTVLGNYKPLGKLYGSAALYEAVLMGDIDREEVRQNLGLISRLVFDYRLGRRERRFGAEG